MARRLTEREKLQIAQGYREGKSSMMLAEEFGCTSNTVVRTVKSALSEEDYKAIKASRMKEEISKDNEIVEITSESNCSSIESSFENERLLIDSSEEDSSVFKEFVPLVTDFGFEDREQKVNSKPLVSGVLPETVYILVDKKVELEYVHLSDLSDWNFLPDLEKERKVIPLFLTQREAKRTCSRSQRVIKIPNTKIFEITKDYLLSKGITRLVIEDSLITLDN